jgi:uroporphyrinogen III methyltransferase/synthase
MKTEIFMTNLSQVLRVGTRNSKLALIQTNQAVGLFQNLAPCCQFTISEFSSPGDRNQSMDLRISPEDFFTKDLDESLLSKTIDAAIHSAKDLPQIISKGIDWCWLPIKDDPRDVLVLPSGKSLSDLPTDPRIGISSERRESWCKKQFPSCSIHPIRGTIERRLEQLDNGYFDIVIMAAAALIRLELTNRISQWIEQDDLCVPDGQGILALTFRENDPFWIRFRNFFVKPVIFAGAGIGRSETCTKETIDALKNAEICIYDSLLDKKLIDFLPSDALPIDAGKRQGEHTLKQEEINELILKYARRGFKIVRLKGGDPGIFGRLSEEIDTLDTCNLPYRVLPGISSLQCATTGTGMLLTRRGVSRGFCVLTPRSKDGSIADITSTTRGNLSQAYFMGISSVASICAQLLSDKTSPDTPAAAVFGAGSQSEIILKGTVMSLPAQCASLSTSLPGIILVGSITEYSYKQNGILGGIRILNTSSKALQQTVSNAIYDLGGIPIPYPSVSLVTKYDGLQNIACGELFDWLVVTSPSAVHAMIEALNKLHIDIRKLPPIVVSGDGTAKALVQYNLYPSIVPTHNFGVRGILDATSGIFKPGQKVLRLRSDIAGDSLSQELSNTGAMITDKIICLNQPINNGPIPDFDIIFFASSSAVSSLFDREDPVDLHDRLVCAIGAPTRDTLFERGVSNVIMGREATASSAIEQIAITHFCKMFTNHKGSE